MIELATAAAAFAVIGLTVFIAVSRSLVARWKIGLPAMLLGAATVSWGAAAAFHDASSSSVLFVLLLVALLPLNFVLRSMRWPSRFFFVSAFIVSVAFAWALLLVTFTTQAQPLGFGLSILLLIFEFGALSLSLVFAFEIADALGHPSVEPLPPSPA